MRKPQPPELVGANWTGSYKDEQGPVVEYRGGYAIRSDEPRPVKAGFVNIYHATPYLSEILSKGQVLPAGLTGKVVLGGSTRHSSVSFSGTLEAAAYTAVCIAEINLIANNKISLIDVLNRAKILGIPLINEAYTGFLQYWSIFNSYKISDSELLDAYLWASEGNSLKYKVKVALTEEENIDYVWKAYKAMLQSGCFNKKIPDPLFMGSIKTFEKLNKADIGVICAKLQPAVWVSKAAPVDHEKITGAFTYIGHDRSIFMPDTDEYRVFDYKSLTVIDSYSLEDCVKILELSSTFWEPIIQTTFLKLRKNPFPTPKGKEPLDSYSYEHMDRYGKTKWIEIETISPLYHATTSVSGILENGFLPRALLDNRQALGGGSSWAISFTGDKKLACGIAYHLKNFILIAQEKISLDDIILFTKQYNIYDKVKKFWLGSGQVSHYEEDDPELHIKKLREKKICKSVRGLAKWVKELNSTDDLHPKTNTWLSASKEPLFSGLYFEEISHMDYLHELFKFYNCVIWNWDYYENPLFFGLDVKNFVNLDPDDVGVVEATLHEPILFHQRFEYELTQAASEGNPLAGSVTYLPSMDEIRVYDCSHLEVIDVIRDCPHPRRPDDL